ncbi:MAG: glycosyltransferase family 39 protein, partial [Planctomycetes bacterium]|nr:glycosyltransferase family 39 protein [Planctomycetota bacterium]
ARVSGGEVTPLVARLPAALATILTVLVVYLFGRQLKGHTAGLIAALAVATSLRLLWIGRVANLDSMLLLWTTLAFYLFWRAWRREGSWLAYLPMFGAIALGIMTKGHIALVIVGAVVGPFLLWQLVAGERRRAWQASWRCVPGLLLCLAVTAPWFIAMHYRTDGRFTDEYFVRHHLVRTGWVEPGEDVKDFEKKTDWYDYLARIWPSTFPASIFLPGALLWIALRGRRRGRDDLLFVSIWLVLLMVMFSAMSFRKQEYIMPVYPAAGLLVAVFLTEYFEIRGQNRFWDALLVAAFVGFCLIGVLVAGGTGLVLHEGFASWVEGKMTNENGRFTFEVIRGQLAEHLGLTFAMIAAVVVGYVLSIAFWLRRREMAALALVAAATGAMMLFYVAVFVPVIDDARSHKAFAAEALQHIRPGDFVMANVGEDHELCYLLGSDVLVPLGDGRWKENMRVYDVLDRALAGGRRAWYVIYRDHYLEHPPGKDFRLVLETQGHHRKPLVLLSYKAGAETQQRN